MIQASEQVRAYMAAIGRKGGKVISPRKLAALRANARKPRPGRKTKQDQDKG